MTSITAELQGKPPPPARQADLQLVVRHYRLCALSEGKSEATIAIIECAARQLLSFLNDSGMATDIGDIGVTQLRSFSRHLQNRQAFSAHRFTRPQPGLLSGHTINGYLRALRSLWSFAVFEGLLALNPFLAMKIPDAPVKVIETFSAEQLAALIEAVDMSAPQGQRDRAMLDLLADTALRLSELTGLRLEDIDFERRSLRVRGKGSKERVVPFGIRAHRALLRYVDFHRPEPAGLPIDECFLSWSGRPLTNRRVQAIITRCGKKAGITGVRCSPHTMRHTAAVMWIRNGGDAFTLQRMLGHSSLEMVRVYVNLAQCDVEAAHRRYSPLDNLEIKGARATRSRR